MWGADVNFFSYILLALLSLLIPSLLHSSFPVSTTLSIKSKRFPIGQVANRKLKDAEVTHIAKLKTVTQVGDERIKYTYQLLMCLLKTVLAVIWLLF